MSDVLPEVPHEGHPNPALNYDDAPLFTRANGVQRELLVQTARGIFTGPPIVCVPTYRSLDSACHASVVAAMSWYRHQLGPINHASASGALCDENREGLAHLAVKARSWLTVWIDSDMVFPQEAIYQLVHLAGQMKDELEKKGNLPFFVLGAAYPGRDPSGTKLSALFHPGDFTDPPLEEFTSGPHSWDAIGVGLGFAAVPTIALALLEPPLFERKFDPKLGRYVGEDYSFCARVRDVGGTVRVTTQIPGVGHLIATVQDLSTYVVRRQMVESGQVEIPATVRLRRGPASPHQKGGVVYPEGREK